jgi:glucan phosphorylase
MAVLRILKTRRSQGGSETVRLLFGQRGHALAALDGYWRAISSAVKQFFVDGMQCETADDWDSDRDPWSCRRDDRTIIVKFADQTVRAVPYDTPVIGYKNGHVCTLRLWQSEAAQELDFAAFNNQEYNEALREKNEAEDLTRVLYPNDCGDAGKKLRLKQQYFLSSASLQDIIARYKRARGNGFKAFPRIARSQLNDTHPVISPCGADTAFVERGRSALMKRLRRRARRSLLYQPSVMAKRLSAGRCR